MTADSFIPSASVYHSSTLLHCSVFCCCYFGPKKVTRFRYLDQIQLKIGWHWNGEERARSIPYQYQLVLYLCSATLWIWWISSNIRLICCILNDFHRFWQHTALTDCQADSGPLFRNRKSVAAAIDRSHGYNYYPPSNRRSLAICDIYLMPIHLICIRFVFGYMLELDPNQLTYCSDGIFASVRRKKMERRKTNDCYSIRLQLIQWKINNISTYYDFSTNISDQITVHMCY